MHIYISGLGAGTGPLAVLAKQAGYTVSASDKVENDYTDYAAKNGVDVHIGQDAAQVSQIHDNHPIDWLVYSSAIEKENTDHPELQFAAEQNIPSSKRDEFLVHFMEQTNQRMIGIAGTHGKSTTTAMFVWLCQQLKIPISYLVGAKMPFADAASFDPSAQYFVYEADEYDRNFLSFHPAISLLPGIAYDHPDIYPTQESYAQAFRDYIAQSDATWLWKQDAELVGVESSENIAVMHQQDYVNIAPKVIGQVNRDNAALVAQVVYSMDESLDMQTLSDILDKFPGVTRRFEQLMPNIYTDYAHTPEKIAGALQVAQEAIHAQGLAGLTVVYEGLHNTRQHFIIDELPTLFAPADELFIVPSYRAREDESLEDLTPEKLASIITQPQNVLPMQLNESLAQVITSAARQGKLVLCLSAGGSGSLDEWLRNHL